MALCSDRNKAGDPCGSQASFADGRCWRHSGDPLAVEKRGAQDAKAAKASSDALEGRQRRKKASRTGPKPYAHLLGSVVEDAPDKDPRAQALWDELHAGVDLKTHDGRTRYLEIAAALASFGEIEPSEQQAWAKTARTAAQDAPEEQKGGGTSVSFFLDEPSRGPKAPEPLDPDEVYA